MRSRHALAPLVPRQPGDDTAEVWRERRDGAAGAGSALGPSQEEQFPPRRAPALPDWRAPGHIVHAREDGTSCAGGDVVGVREDLDTGERQALHRQACIPFADYMDCTHDRDELDPLWRAVAGTRALPMSIITAYQRARMDEDTGQMLRSVPDAWATAWAWDAERQLDKTSACATRTREVVGSDGSVTLSVWRCRDARCRHCGVRIVAAEWARRIEGLAAGAAARREPWALLTLTIDPTAWMRCYGVTDRRAAAVLSQRTVGAMFAALWERVREKYGPSEYLRVIELHESGWPHVHAVVTGGVVEAMRAEGAARGLGTWDEQAAYALDQTQQQADARARGQRRRAQAPSPRTRQALSALAQGCGFGRKLHVRPVLSDGYSALGRYVSKGPLHHGSVKRVPEVDGEARRIAREVSKGEQRTTMLLARGVRCWESSRGMGLPPRPRPELRDLCHVRVLPAPLHVVADVMRAYGARLKEKHAPDFSGPIPARGERRAWSLASVRSDVPAVGPILSEWREQDRAEREAPRLRAAAARQEAELEHAARVEARRRWVRAERERQRGPGPPPSGPAPGG